MRGIRYGHTATLLPDGTVLVAGGVDSFHISGLDILASAELYDPGLGSWSATAGLIAARGHHTATLLPDGGLLVTGGFSFTSRRGVLSSAELYDPDRRSWTATGKMVGGRAGHTATLLPDGRVLVAGGTSSSGNDPVASAEVYDPRSGSWSATGEMQTIRYGHTATLLPDGRVLVAGGDGGDGVLASAELFDPGSGSWTATGKMHSERHSHTATLLPDGRVLAMGGAISSGRGEALASAELYDPSSGSWTVTGSMFDARSFHTATLLPDGSVLAAGGTRVTPDSDRRDTAEVYEPSSGSWTATPRMNEARVSATATLLPDGTLLVAGGGNGLYEASASAELYGQD